MGAAAVAQGISFVASMVMSFLVPKVLGVTEFGYWQLFIFYFNYVGAFQFGLNDGIYLLQGGKSRADLDKREISSEFVFGLVFQVLIATAVVGLVIVSQPEAERLFVLVACAVLMPLYNAACFFQYLLQAIDETQTYSRSIVIDKVAFLAVLAPLLALRCLEFEPYVFAFCFGKLVQLAYCLLSGRGLLVRSLLSLKDSTRVSLANMRVGIKLMFANLARLAHSRYHAFCGGRVLGHRGVQQRLACALGGEFLPRICDAGDDGSVPDPQKGG